MSVISTLQQYVEALSAPPSAKVFAYTNSFQEETVGDILLTIYRNPFQIADEWQEFEKTAKGCLFNSYRWIDAWCRIAANSAGEEVLIATGRDKSGRMLFVWPMAVIASHGTKILTWCAQSHSNYNAANFDKDFAAQVDAATLEALLRTTAKAVRGVTLIYLKSQPVTWSGQANPFLQLPHLSSPNASYTVNLGEDFDALLKTQMGKNGQRNLRRKEKKLRSFGICEIVPEEGLYRRLDVLDQFFTQKAAQFRDTGITNIFSNPALRSFYHDLVTGLDESDNSFELFTLNIDNELIATFNGMAYQGRFYLLLSSLTQDDYRRWSPGLIVMRYHIERHCNLGHNAYDLGTGSGDHKSVWTNETVPLFDTLMPLGATGHLYAGLLSVKTAAKRLIKNNPQLWSFAKSIRQKLGKLKS